MCGICGTVDFSGKTIEPCHVQTMMDKLIHRGPDDKGIYTDKFVGMGHRRLSIIDLTQAGRQPMSNETRTIWLVFNGEIYNFMELKIKLQGKGHQFRSSSDSEVIIHAYEEWGEECWNLFEGIFAFAIWDVSEQTLHLVRDPLGIKPLFYHQQGHRLSFASELLALFGPSQPAPEINWQDVDSYFTFNYVPAPRSGLKNVYQLPAATALHITERGMRSKRYWHPKLTPSPQIAQQDLLFERIIQSVKAQLVSDVPVGIFLSGGLDSFAVMQGAIRSGENPHAYTLGFNEPGFDESEDAGQYLKHLNGQGETGYFAWNRDEITATLGAMGELLADPSCFPFYQLCRIASRGHKVCLSGDGGDELWAGYDTYFASQWLTPALRKLPSLFVGLMHQAARLLPSDNHRYGPRMILNRLLAAASAGPLRDHASFRRIFLDDTKEKLYDSYLKKETFQSDPIADYIGWAGEVPKSRSKLSTHQYMDVMFHLPSILAKVDRMSMAHGLEVRVPLLDRNLVEFSLNLPDASKRQGRKGKLILRESIKPYCLPQALKRKKAGFLPPVDSWFRGEGPMREVFGDFLGYARANLDGLNWSAVESYWQSHCKGHVDGGFVLLSVLQFINWLKLVHGN